MATELQKKNDNSEFVKRLRKIADDIDAGIETGFIGIEASQTGEVEGMVIGLTISEAFMVCSIFSDNIKMTGYDDYSE